VALAALRTGGVAELLGPDLAPRGSLAGVGAGLVLADLDGDGACEALASLPVAAPPDRLRVLRPASPAAPPLHQTAPLDGLVVAGAHADLTGDGLEDAVVALRRGEETELLLVTADPGVAP
jgi:hypothetical protein